MKAGSGSASQIAHWLRTSPSSAHWLRTRLWQNCNEKSSLATFSAGALVTHYYHHLHTGYALQLLRSIYECEKVLAHYCYALVPVRTKTLLVGKHNLRTGYALVRVRVSLTHSLFHCFKRFEWPEAATYQIKKTPSTMHGIVESRADWNCAEPE